MSRRDAPVWPSASGAPPFMPRGATDYQTVYPVTSMNESYGLYMSHTRDIASPAFEYYQSHSCEKKLKCFSHIEIM